MTRQFNVPDVQTPAPPAAVSEKPIVDREACTGCEECVAVCPQAAIEMRDGKAFILSDRCTNCRVCVPACPVEAIK